MRRTCKLLGQTNRRRAPAMMTIGIAIALIASPLIASPLFAVAPQNEELDGRIKQGSEFQRKIPLKQLLDLEHPVVIARYDGDKQLTNVDLYRKLTDRSRPLPKPALELLQDDPDKVLKPLITETIGHEIIFQRALQDEDYTLSEPTAAMVKARDAKINKLILEDEVLSKLSPISEEQIQEYYNLQRDEFTTPFQFRIRSIFLMTYQPYTVQQGDTLESIAEKISGDRALAERIIDEATKEPRAGERPPKSAREEAAAVRPLLEGEKLLAPMNKEKMQEVRQRMEAIKKQLDEGGDFQQLAREHTEDPSQGELSMYLPSGPKPMIPEVFAAAQQLSVGSCSDILQTKHGFQIIKMEEKHEAETMPLEEARAQIKGNLEGQAREQGVQKFWDSMMETPELKINMENLMAKNAADDLEIATLGAFKYLWRDLRADAQEQGIPAGQEDRLKLMKRSQKLNGAVYMAFVAEKRYMDHPEVKNAVQIAHKEAVISQYLKLLVDKRLDGISEAELRAFYEKNKQQIKLPASSRVYEIIKRVGTDPEAIAAAMAELTEVQKQIRTLEDMKRVAGSEVNLEPLRQNQGFRGDVHDSYRGNDFMFRVKLLELNQVHGPFEGLINGVPDVFLIWIESRQPERTPSFEGFEEPIKGIYKNTMLNSTAEKIVQEIAAAAKIEYLY
jgi:parvulin-like peptidyl-prolyl isomerase